MKKSELILGELQRISSNHRGRLPVDAVVKAAKAPTSAMHKRFTWNDKKCGMEHRRWQARELIQQYWVVEPASQQDIRMFISIESDRRKKGGGYRTWESILNDPDRRAEFVEMAFVELEQFEKQYGALSELRPIFAAIRRARSRSAAAE